MCPLLGGRYGGASFRKVYQQNSCMSYPWEQPLVQIQIGSLAQQTSQYLRDFLVNQESKAQVWASFSSLSCIFHPQIALIFWNKYKQVRVAGLAPFSCFLLLCLLPVCFLPFRFFLSSGSSLCFSHNTGVHK